MSAEWTQQHIQKFIASFEEADKDKSGSLSMDEVVSVLEKNGFKGSKKDAEVLFRQLDVNRDQKLTRDEFSAAVKKLPRVSVKEFVLRKAFRCLDKDGSGKLSRGELEEALKAVGTISPGCRKEGQVAISRDKLEQLIAQLDSDPKDNLVDYEEFLLALGMEESGTVMQYLFNKLDANNSGFLTKDEIIQALNSESELKMMRAAKISDLLVAVNKDSDGKLDYNEFVREWVKYK
ncbi:hypothetical protein ACOMHN_043649 [Nucella lapillus]